MKVLHIITGLGIGGAENTLLKLLKYNYNNKNSNHHVIVLRDDLIDLKNEFTKYSNSLILLKLNRARDLLSAFKLINQIRIIKPDIVQGWMYHGNIIAILYKILFYKRIKAGLNIRQTINKLRDFKLSTRLILIIGAIFSRSSDFIIYNSINSRDKHRKYKYNKKNNFIIYNGVDTSIYKPLNHQKISENTINNNLNDILIGTISAFHPFKDYNTLIEVFSLVKSKYNNAKLVLIGRGNNSKNLKLMNLINKHNINESVILIGQINNVIEYLPKFNLFLLTSIMEGFPNVLIEAMSCGIPVVSTNVGDVSEIINNSSFVNDPGDVQGLAKSCLHVLEMSSQSKKMLNINLRKRVISNFSIEKMVYTYNVFYNSINES